MSEQQQGALARWLQRFSGFASRSIRGSLVVWVAILLSGVLVFFGGLLYETNRRLTVERIDGELRSFGISLLTPGRPGFRPPFGDNGDRGGRGRGGRDFPDRDSSARDFSGGDFAGRNPNDRDPAWRGDGPPPEAPPPEPRAAEPPGSREPGRVEPGRAEAGRAEPGRPDPGRGEPGPREFGPREMDRRGPPDRLYFVVRREDTGEVLDRSFDLPEDALDPFPENLPRGPAQIREPTQLRQVGSRWEMKIVDPSRTRSIVVGRFVQREWDDLQRLLAWTAVIALVSLAIGIAGTWLLAQRVLAPLDDISKTVATLTASKLDQRIDVAPLKTELQSVARVLNTTFDRLQAGFERQVRFTSDASHELRTPIAVVLAQTEHALARERAPEDYRQALGACQRSASRMRTLVESLLALARADSGRLQLASEPVDLVPVVEQAIASVTPRAEVAGLKIATQLTSAVVAGDAVFLGQVVTNLLTNAIEYNHPDGMIFVTVAADAEHARVSVADTGRGMSAEERSHLFERFFRADTARSASGTTGHGLGLAICREIIELHGGRIDVSTELGRGSTFCLVLPLHRPEALTKPGHEMEDAIQSITDESAKPMDHVEEE
ncbi:MAG: hypothetical protein C0478_02425 [Planctomyces sp.]|nr:hypothetical protein [Planctomyces sp.]